MSFNTTTQGLIGQSCYPGFTRTGVEIIEKLYSSNLSAEMNIDLLLGRR